MNIFNALGSVLSDIIGYPLGALMKVFFAFTQNYALLLVLFTIIVQAALFPLAIKQQRSSAEMLRMKPKLDKIQKKYAKDKEKLQMEMSKLYQEEGYNPLSGCLPLLIQMPILIGLYQVVYNPLKYIMWFSQGTIDKVASVLRTYIGTTFNVTNFNDPKIQIYIAKAMGDPANKEKLSFLGNVKNIDFSLFGIDLSERPQIGFTILVLVPILVFISQAVSSFLSFQLNKKVQEGQPGSKSTNILMSTLMPLMSAWFSVAFPAAIGFYWIITNVIMIIRTILLQKFYSLDKLAAQAEIDAQKRKQAILNGTAKKSRLQEYAQRVLEAQQQQQQQQQQQNANAGGNNSVKKEQQSPQTQVKLNSKGNKSRSQIKAEQRRRLAQSRKKMENK
jgi:YidC/Oxa1 family membrane protein insertase